MQSFIRLLRREAGASSAEYAIILAVVGSAIVLAAIFLGDSVAGSMNEASNEISGH